MYVPSWQDIISVPAYAGIVIAVIILLVAIADSARDKDIPLSACFAFIAFVALLVSSNYSNLLHQRRTNHFADHLFGYAPSPSILALVPGLIALVLLVVAVILARKQSYYTSGVYSAGVLISASVSAWLLALSVYRNDVWELAYSILGIAAVVVLIVTSIAFIVKIWHRHTEAVASAGTR